MSRIRRHLWISGRVQGVCFRYYTRRTALANRVVGWVRNLPDGRVEALFEGEKAAVEATVAWCHQGPETARVNQVEIKEEEISQPCTDFSIR